MHLRNVLSSGGAGSVAGILRCWFGRRHIALDRWSNAVNTEHERASEYHHTQLMDVTVDLAPFGRAWIVSWRLSRERVQRLTCHRRRRL